MSRNTAQQDPPVREAPRASLSFLQQPFVQSILPFATSLLLHLGILLIGYVTFVAVKKVSSVIREQIIIPDATLVEGAEVGGVPNPGLGTDPNITSDVKLDIQEQQQMAERSSISVGQIGGDSSESVIGIGSGTAKLRAGGFGSGGEAQSSPFGVPGGSGGVGPRSPFMGVSGNAYRVAYVCDASGSMLPSRGTLLKSLNEAVDRLKPVQFFNVFFYHPGGIYEALNKGQLIPATPDNKRQAYTFAESYQAESNGQPDNPSTVIRAAMQMKPQLVYFLTDGVDGSADDFTKRLRNELNRLNSSREVHVNIIYLFSAGQFKQLGGKENTQQREAIVSDLKAIAEENGGRFRQVEPD